MPQGAGVGHIVGVYPGSDSLPKDVPSRPDALRRPAEVHGHAGPLSDDDLAVLTPATLADRAFAPGPPQAGIDH